MQGLIIGTTAGTIKGVRLAAGMNVYLPAGVMKGMKLPLTVDDCVNPARFGRVNVYVGGVLDLRLGLVLKSDGLYLGGSQRGTVITIR